MYSPVYPLPKSACEFDIRILICGTLTCALTRAANLAGLSISFAATAGAEWPHS